MKMLLTDRTAKVAIAVSSTVGSSSVMPALSFSPSWTGPAQSPRSSCCEVCRCQREGRFRCRSFLAWVSLVVPLVWFAWGTIMPTTLSSTRTNHFVSAACYFTRQFKAILGSLTKPNHLCRQLGFHDSVVSPGVWFGHHQLLAASPPSPLQEVLPRFIRPIRHEVWTGNSRREIHLPANFVILLTVPRV